MFIYDGSALANVRGGAARGRSYQGMLRWQVALDGERAFGWTNTTAYFNLMNTHHVGPTVLTGDAQGVSNMAAPSGLRLEEAWIQRNFDSGRFSALIGRYDLNSEFYRLNSAGLFLNSSFGVGPEFSQTGISGPSIFPSTAIGIRIAYKPEENFVIRAAVFDGVPVDRDDGRRAAFRGGDGLLLVYEMAWLNRPTSLQAQPDRRFLIGRASGLDPYSDKIAAGIWHYTTRLDDLSDLDVLGRPVRRAGSTGVYVLADTLIYHSQGDPSKQLTGFLQLGASDARTNRFDGYLGLGLVATGLVSGRPNDEVGIAAASARNGKHFLLGSQQLPGLSRAETTIELTYLTQLENKMSLQPSVQYVVHPNTDATLARAITLQLRAEIAF